MKAKLLFKRYWKDTERVGHVDVELFSEILDYYDLSRNGALINGESKTIGEFRKEFYDHEGFLYITNCRVNNKDNSFLVKDNLDREFHIQDIGAILNEELIDMPEFVELPDNQLEPDEMPL